MIWIRFALIALVLSSTSLVLAQTACGQDRPDREFQECPECPKMVAIPAGRFMMGSPIGERGRFDSEGPRHPVSIRAFAISKFLVTNAEFLIFLQQSGYQPSVCDPMLGLTWVSRGRGEVYPPGGPASPPLEPATCLSWEAAEAYVAWLNNKVRGLPSAAKSRDGPYRLPSEAEWEYAARAGTTTARWWGDAIGTGNADCIGCGSAWDGRMIAPVGSFPANPFGLHDMLGDVWQWVGDCWNESYLGAPSDGRAWTSGDCSRRVLRGGSWNNIATFVRSAARSRAEADGEDFDMSIYAGFHVARSLP